MWQTAVRVFESRKTRGLSAVLIRSSTTALWHLWPVSLVSNFVPLLCSFVPLLSHLFVTCVKFCATFVWDPRCESCRSRRCVQAQRTAPVPAFVSLLCLAAQTLSASPHKFSTCSHILWQISQTRKLQENLTNQNTFKPSTSGQLICPDICHKFCVPRHASVYVCVCPS